MLSCVEVNLYAHLTAVAHNSHVGSYHRRDASLLRRVDDLVHQLHILVVDDGVYGEIALHAVLCADGCYLVQVSIVKWLAECERMFSCSTPK